MSAERNAKPVRDALTARRNAELLAEVDAIVAATEKRYEDMKRAERGTALAASFKKK
jgi:hypothetical protein